MSGTFFGSSGTSGTNGTSGLTSSNGTSGTSGISGTNGLLNLSGTTDNGVITYVNASTSGRVNTNLTFNGSTLVVAGAVSPITYNETYSNLGTGGSFAIDLSTANNFVRTVNATTTITLTNQPSGKAFGFTLSLINGGAYAITWPSVKWASGVAPNLSTSGTDIIVIYTYDGGSTYYGFLTGKNMA